MPLMVYVKEHIFSRFFTPVYAVISIVDKGGGAGGGKVRSIYKAGFYQCK